MTTRSWPVAASTSKARSSSPATAQGWRGLKPKLAYEHGAVGCLIYSDPQDDGYSQGDVYPKGGWRPAGSVQRGSVADMPVYRRRSADPRRRRHEEGEAAAARRRRATVLKIPVMPISYGDAQPLLAALEGPVAPGRLARRASDHLSHRSRPRESASDDRIRLELEAALQRDREDPGRARAPTNGSCAATTAMAGCSAPGIRFPATWR